MEGVLSKTALVHQGITEFWNDGQPHSLREFQSYLEQNYTETIKTSYINGAIHTARQQDMLERIGRGIYKAGINFYENERACSEATNGIKYVLKKTQNALSIPVNLMNLNQKERELVPKLQELYQICERLLNELESEDKSNEVSE